MGATQFVEKHINLQYVGHKNVAVDGFITSHIALGSGLKFKEKYNI